MGVNRLKTKFLVTLRIILNLSVMINFENLGEGEGKREEWGGRGLWNS